MNEQTNGLTDKHRNGWTESVKLYPSILCLLNSYGYGYRNLPDAFKNVAANFVLFGWKDCPSVITMATCGTSGLASLKPSCSRSFRARSVSVMPGHKKKNS